MTKDLKMTRLKIWREFIQNGPDLAIHASLIVTAHKMICQGLSSKNRLQLTHTCNTHIFCNLHIQKQAHKYPKFPQPPSLLSYAPNYFKTKLRYHIIQPEECSGNPNHTMAPSSLSPLVQSKLSGLRPPLQPLPGGAGAASGSLPSVCLVSPLCVPACYHLLCVSKCLCLSATVGAEFIAVFISTNLSRVPAVCWASSPRADVLVTGRGRRHTVQPRIAYLQSRLPVEVYPQPQHRCSGRWP